MKSKGTPIQRIREANEILLKILREYGIETIESFLALGSSKSVRLSLMGALKTSDTEFASIMIKAQQGLASAKGIKPVLPVRSNRKYPLGAGSPKSPHKIKKQLQISDHLEPDVDLSPIMTIVKDQGEGGTCVAFSMIAAREALEILLNQNVTDLSEQCLFYHCKQIDGAPNIDGTWPECALEILLTNGVCEENHWPYVKKHDRKNIIQGPLPENCDPDPPPCTYNNPDYFKIKGHVSLEANSIDTIKVALHSQLAVVATVPVYESWLASAWVEDGGEINMPLPGELLDRNKFAGNHAICLAGYSDKYKTFFFKNSWGNRWAMNSAFKSGYGQLPYDYIKKFNVEAIVFEP